MGAEIVFETERLYARAWRVEADAPGALRMYGDPEMVRHIGGKLTTSLDEQKATLTRVLDRARHWNGRFGSWPLFDKSSDELVGCAILKPTPASGTGGKGWSEDIGVGWHVTRSRWGQGLATETGYALLAYGFDALGFPSLHAVVEPANERSLAVARRIGMRHLGRTMRYCDLELEHFALTASEWRAPRG